MSNRNVGETKGTTRLPGNFLLFWFGQTVSQFGSAMTAFTLLIYVFQESGTVLSTALLSVCTYASGFIGSFFAGPVIDKLPKKTAMLIADSIAAFVTAFTLIMLHNNSLEVWYLYVINTVIGFCNALQGPASSVAVSIIVPKDAYIKASGLQSFTDSMKGILTPVLATALFALGGMNTVLAVDLVSFAFAFMTLLFFIRIPESKGKKESESREKKSSYFADMKQGLMYAFRNRGLFHIILYLGLVNFIAAIAFYCVMNPMILARTGGNELILGYVNSCIGIGAAIGGLITATVKIKKPTVTLMGLCYMFSFISCDIMLGIGRTSLVWCVAAFLGSISLPMGDGILSALFRNNTELEIQGRVFSLRYSFNNACILVGSLVGALLADNVVESLVSTSTALQWLVGTGPGRAMGILFVGTGLTGFIASAVVIFDKHIRKMKVE